MGEHTDRQLFVPESPKVFSTTSQFKSITWHTSEDVIAMVHALVFKIHTDARMFIYLFWWDNEVCSVEFI